jgi:hypothetical protein
LTQPPAVRRERFPAACDPKYDASYWIVTKVEAVASWPQSYSRNSSLDSSPCVPTQALSSFGVLDLHVISLNLENLTSNIHSPVALRDTPKIHTVSFYIAMGPKYGKMLNIHGDIDDDGAIPTGFISTSSSWQPAFASLESMISTATVLQPCSPIWTGGCMLPRTYIAINT